MRSGRTRYAAGQGEQAALEAIAAHLARRSGTTVSTEEVLYTAGTQNGLCTCLMTLVHPGDEVLVPDPYYATYEGLVAASGATFVPVATTPEDRFHVTAEAIERRITPNSRVRAISPRHEQGAGFMADGWSIVTGRPGVCVLISGPGVTNALTPIAQAYHDSRPMLVLASTTPTEALGAHVGPLHDLPDQAALVRSVCAFSETVTDPDQLPELIERAWNVFTSSRPRPVHLAIPMDVLEAECEQFARVKIPTQVPAPTSEDLARAAEILNASQSLVIIAGGGAKDAGDALVALAETLDAPVVLTGNAKGVVASRHPLCSENTLVFGRIQREIESADAVLVVGSELSDTDLYNNGRALAFTGSVVRIDIDEEQITRRVTPSVSLVGDARTTLNALRALVTPGAPRNGATRAQTWREHSRNKTSKDFAPWLEAIERALP
ncbi:aminotransferase class I/II-fold pyridoxal phosphate-dependent enzyme, partial [bacterium]|nr:aminotransferase class I/II-fold pyridoxal phosphate-dependent enzyme [bacterium]